jgi:hypothetical protein
MTAEQIRALGPAFAAYLRPFEPCFVDCSTSEHLHTYCRARAGSGWGLPPIPPADPDVPN